MPIRAACQCGKAFAAPDNLAGKTVKCPGCGQPLKIPAAGAAAAPNAAPAPRPQPRPQPQPAPQPMFGGLGDLLDEAGITQHAGPRCPACDAPIAPQAVVCTKCGFNRQTGSKAAEAQVRKSGDGHGDVASSLLERAKVAVEAAPVHSDDKNTGGARSWWTWAFMLYLPMAFASGFITAGYWGVPIALLKNVVVHWVMSGYYFTAMAPLISVGGVLICLWGITQLMDGIFEHSKNQAFILAGIATALQPIAIIYVLATNGGEIYIKMFRGYLGFSVVMAVHTLVIVPPVIIYWIGWGTVFFRKVKIAMWIFYIGYLIANYGTVLLATFVAADAGNYLIGVLAHLYYLAFVFTLIGWLNITGFAGEEHWAHGVGSLLGFGIYTIVYGIMRWDRCKVWLIMYLSSYPVAIGLTLGIWLGTSAVNLIESRIRADIAESTKPATE